jgi:hypothetical protein
MVHPIYRVHCFEIVSAYTLRIQFDDGAVQTIDFRPILAGEMYGPLRNLEAFNRVRIDSEAGTIVCLTERTSTRLHCMTGRHMSGLFENSPAVGNQSRPNSSCQRRRPSFQGLRLFGLCRPRTQPHWGHQPVQRGARERSDDI